MSTKVTLSHSDDYHLYAECFENDNVYLRLDPGALSAFETSGVNRNTSVTVGIPIKVWRQIVAGWLDSYWADHPDEVDNAPIEFGDLDWLDARPKALPGVWMPAEAALKTREALSTESVWRVVLNAPMAPVDAQGVTMFGKLVSPESRPEQDIVVVGETEGRAVVIHDGDWVYYMGTVDQYDPRGERPVWPGPVVAQAEWSDKGRAFGWDGRAVHGLWTPAEAAIMTKEAACADSQWAWVRPDSLGSIGGHGRAEGPIGDAAKPGDWWVYLGSGRHTITDSDWHGLVEACEDWDRLGWTSVPTGGPAPDGQGARETVSVSINDPAFNEVLRGIYADEAAKDVPRMVWWTIAEAGSRDVRTLFVYRDPTNGQRVVMPECDPHPEEIAKAMGWEAVRAGGTDNADSVKGKDKGGE